MSSASSSMYSMEIEPVTVNKVRAQPWVRSKDYVRCFCNLPQCIRTGYMCKSSQGGCFSNFLDHFGGAGGHHSKDYRARHGCLELINKEHKCEISADRDGNVTTKKQNDPKSLVFCCYHDMCNHVDSPQTKTIINNTLMGEEPNENPMQHHHDSIGDLPQPIDYSNSQVWFRAATIAVPVCGAVILFVLIALAVKILRSENQNGNVNRKLGAYEVEDDCKQNRTYENLLRKNQEKSGLYHHHSDDLQRIQMPLLIQNEIVSHLSNKNETNAKFNLINGESIDKQVNKAVILDIGKECTSKCDNINLVPSDCSKDEKIFVKQLTHHQLH